MSPLEIDSFYSEEAQEIIGGEPSWMIRRGMLILALVILVLLFLCAFVHYPETIRGSITLKADSAGVYDSKATIDLLSANKIKVGQRAIIQLTDFPPGTSGRLEAHITGIIESPIDSASIVTVKLQNGPTASLKQKEKPNKILYGRISIIVETTTIFKKLFGRLYSIQP